MGEINILELIGLRLFDLAKGIYETTFHIKITPNINQFIKNIGWSFVGITGGIIIAFFVNIAGGRIIGPAEYGKYSLIVSTATFLSLPIVLGCSGAIQKYLAQNPQERKKIISTAYAFILISTIIWPLVYLALGEIIIKLFRIDSEILLLGIGLTVVLSSFEINEASMQGLLKIKKNSFIKIITYLALLVCFIGLMIVKIKLNYTLIYIPVLISYALFSLLILINLRKYFFDFNYSWLKRIIHFSIYVVLIRISFVIMTNIDKLIIGYFLSLKEVGIYQSYLVGFLSMNILLTPFLTVYFPTISKAKNKYAVYKKMNRLSLPIFIVTCLFLVPVTYVILRMYGAKYSIDFILILLFALSGGLFAVHALYGPLLSSKTKGIKIVSVFLLITMAVNIILNLTLIPLIGIYGAVIATISSYCVLIILYLSTKGEPLKD